MEINTVTLITSVLGTLITAAIVGVVSFQFKMAKTVAKLCEWSSNHEKSDDERHENIQRDLDTLFRRTERPA